MKGKAMKSASAMKGKAKSNVVKPSSPSTAMKGTAMKGKPMKGKPMKSMKSAASIDGAGAPDVIVPRVQFAPTPSGPMGFDVRPMDFDEKPARFASARTLASRPATRSS